MEDMEAKIGAILGNPQMMQQIMSLAQSMTPPEATAEPAAPAEPVLPDIDLSMLGKLSGLATSAGIDQNQKLLLKALTPYLSHARIDKLERAMKAAKMANLAVSVLGNGSLFSKGR